MAPIRPAALIAVAACVLAACGGGGNSDATSDAAPTITEEPATTTTTVFMPLDADSPGAEAMCGAIRSTAGAGTGATAIEKTIRGQLIRWQAVAEVAPSSLAEYAAAVVEFYERSVAAREEFGFDVTAQAEAGRLGDNRETGEELAATAQMDEAVSVLCDQDPPGTFELVEVDEAMLAFCAHFAAGAEAAVGAQPGTAEFNELYWGGRAALWQDSVPLAPDEIAGDAATFADRYDRIIEIYEDVDYDLTEAVKAGINRAREATDDEMAALETVSGYLADACGVTETGDSGAFL
jgi:hypothetical protein